MQKLNKKPKYFFEKKSKINIKKKN